MREFTRERRIDARRWRFLTGPATAVEDVVVRGFKLSMGKPETDATGRLEVLHAARFVLVDERRQIRGYYDADAEGMARLEQDLRRLVRPAQDARPAESAPR